MCQLIIPLTLGPHPFVIARFLGVGWSYQMQVGIQYCHELIERSRARTVARFQKKLLL